MSYIEFKEQIIKKLACNYPKVKKIWEFGGGASTNTVGFEMARYICIQLDDDTVHSFEDDGKGDAIKEAENFLNQLT